MGNDPYAPQRGFGTLENGVGIAPDFSSGWIVNKNWLAETRDSPIITAP
jgi:hypothetical protein